METIIYKIRHHWAAIGLAIIFGAIMIAPFFYFSAKLGSDFQGVLPAAVNDVSFYYARINDVLNGHSFLSNAYLYEHKNGLPQQLFLAEWFLAQPIKLFNLSINAARIVYNFLLPAIAFILTYIALFLVSKSRLWSIIFSVFLFFGLYLLAFFRPISPQFNFIFWLTQFIFLWLFIVERKQKWIWPSAINFGLLFYIYPYYWTFYLIFFGLLMVAYYLMDKKLATKILFIIGGGLILAIPYFYLNYLSSQLPYYAETLTRLGMIYSHFPSGLRIIFWSIFGLMAFSWFLWRRIIILDEKIIFFISGILASVIAVNQHLITGKNFEFSSHYDMGAMFFLAFVGAYLWRILRENQNNLRFLSVILLSVVLVFSGYGLFGYAKRVFAIDANTVYQQNYTPIFEWLNKNSEKDSVVYANVDLSMLIPVYTANNVFYVREANLFFISDKEILDRFILNNFFSAFSEDFVIENERAIFGVRHIDNYGHAVQGNKLRRLLGLRLEPEIYLPENAIEKVITRTKELQKGDFVKKLKQYRVDYLIWDKNKNPNWKITENLKPIFKSGDLIIFKFLNL